jgi:hypothetical protein
VSCVCSACPTYNKHAVLCCAVLTSLQMAAPVLLLAGWT